MNRVSNAAKGYPQLKELEARIGHSFDDQTLLECALTHASARQHTLSVGDYERLEFLGDRVLGLCMADFLYRKFPDVAEGDLNVRFSALVNGRVLAEISDNIRLHDFVRTGSDMQKITGKRMQSVRADVLEAVIASIYLDGGLPTAQRFIEKFWNSKLDDIASVRRDSKTELQEWAHGQGYSAPRYVVIDRAGPDHDPEFTVCVRVEGQPEKQANGRSKRKAEQLAAEKLLVELGVWSGDE